MKIIFIGSVKFSASMLEKLIQLKAELVGVCTSKRSKINSDHFDLTDVCKKNSIPVNYSKNINSQITIDWIKSRKPDIIFCFGWSRLLKKELLSIPNRGVVGYHPALLPLNRGRHPLIWALSLGLKETGSTFFFMKEGADDGDIINQRKIKINNNDNASSLYDKVTKTASKQLEVLLHDLKTGTEKRIKQNNSKSNNWRKRSIHDGKIDWRMSAVSIYNLVRSLSNPYPNAHFEYDDRSIKVLCAKIVKNSNNNIEPGKVLSNNKKGMVVKSGSDSIFITHMSPKLIIKKGTYL